MWISEQMQLITSAWIIYSLCVGSNSLPCPVLPGPSNLQQPPTCSPFTRPLSIAPYTILRLPAATLRYSAIAAKESLSGLETEMRKLEGLVKEVQDEMDYLKRREMRFQSTNGKSRPPPFAPLSSPHLLSPLCKAGPIRWCMI